jgi:hypothetical protein
VDIRCLFNEHKSNPIQSSPTALDFSYISSNSKSIIF